MIDFFTRNIIGKIGEHYIMLELLKSHIGCGIIGHNNLKNSPDIILENNITLEVKTSVYISKRFKSTSNKSILKGGWSFAETTRSKSTYVTFVMLNEDLSIYKIVMAKSENLTYKNWKYYKPHEEHFLQTVKGPLPKETTPPKYMFENWVEIIKMLIQKPL